MNPTKEGMRWIAAAMAPTLLLASTPAVWACGFIDQFANSPTISRDAADAKFVLYGYLQNARKEPGAGTTELVVVRALKGDSSIANKKIVTVPRYVEIEEGQKPHFLVFGDIKNGKLDPLRGLRCSESLLDFAEGLLAIDRKDRVAVMKYCFPFLDHSDTSNFAYFEFVTSRDNDIGRAARTFPREKLRSMLANDKLDRQVIRLYGFLLGNRGNDDDAAFLRTIIDKYKTASGTELDGVISGCILLQPKEGWKLARELAADSRNEFGIRYAVLRTVRFLHNARPDVIPEMDRLDVLRMFLDQSDMADLPIVDLASWRNWSLTDHILSLLDKKSHSAPIVRRAILRYALQCPQEKAQKLITAERLRDSELVADVEQLLLLGKKQ